MTRREHPTPAAGRRGGDLPAIVPVAGYVAECFWAGVTDEDLRALDARVGASVAELTGSGDTVSYLGSIFMRADEVVLCRFEGAEASVRRLAERAGIPFERIVEVSDSPGPVPGVRRTRITTSDDPTDQGSGTPKES